MAAEKDTPEVDVEHTPEELAEIEASNRERRKNINKIFAIMVGICLVIFGIFLAVFIGSKNADDAKEPAMVTTEVEIPVQPGGGGPAIQFDIEQDTGQ
ncbi:MAG: hypothetical protein WAN89_06830 [Lawsonella sp.]|nr:hypothetical protein [Mycobacteriales bacterium]